VGVEGLTSTKWRLVSKSEAGHTVTQFGNGECQYTHKKLPLTESQ